MTSSLARLKGRLFPTLQQREFVRWSRDGGDETLLQEFQISKDDLVVDVGGFAGQWASDIFARYLSRVWVFEPVPSYAEQIKRRFAANPAIRVFPFGLGDREAKLPIFIQGSSSSFVQGEGESVTARIADAAEVLKAEGRPQIALMKINIEGGEYSLLPRLFEQELVPSVRDFLIQFHPCLPDADERRATIREQISRTHRCVWSYDFIWERWTRV